jgi:hypothetical protein
MPSTGVTIGGGLKGVDLCAKAKQMVIRVYGENDLPHGEGSFVVPVVGSVVIGFCNQMQKLS